MRVVPRTIYRFSELSEKAKDRAKQEYAAIGGYHWSDDAMKSIKSLAEHFGGKLKDYNIDWFDTMPSDAKFVMPDMDKDEIAENLKVLGEFDPATGKGHGDCKLTGACHDEDAIDGFRIAFRGGESDLTRLMNAAFKSWLKAGQSECEAQYENDTFSEMSDANDYEYDVNGELV